MMLVDEDVDSLDLGYPTISGIWLDDPLEPIGKNEICPFTVCVDTREQAAFHFLNCDPWPLIALNHIGLETGDYSILGFESRITIERKSISDLLGSITAERDRFEREFERLNQFESASVVVEGELSDVLRHAKENTELKLQSITGTFDAWRIRYPRVHWIFCIGRRHAELQTLGLLTHFWKEKQKEAKQ